MTKPTQVNSAEPNAHDQHASLDRLWQGQLARSVDTKQIVSQAKKQRFKQRLYMSLDVLGMLPLLSLLFIDIKLTLFLKWFVALNGVVCLLFLAYLAKLRWVSAFGHADTTEGYLQNLLKQLKNNAMIARVNKHSAWIAFIIVILGINVDRYLNSGGESFTWIKFSAALIFAVVFVLAWMAWAHKRQRRFEKEALDLERLLG